jgi:hypothetical protein
MWLAASNVKSIKLDIIPKTEVTIPGVGKIAFNFYCYGSLEIPVDPCKEVTGCLECRFELSGGQSVGFGADGNLRCTYCYPAKELSCGGEIRLYVQFSFDLDVAEAGCRAGVSASGTFGGEVSVSAFAECTYEVSIGRWFKYEDKWYWSTKLLTL